MDPFSRKGFVVIQDIIPVTANLCGITPMGGGCEITAIDFPATSSAPGSSPAAYRGDAAILGLALAEGVFYPIASTSITISGTAIGWLA